MQFAKNRIMACIGLLEKTQLEVQSAELAGGSSVPFFGIGGTLVLNRIRIRGVLEASYLVTPRSLSLSYVEATQCVSAGSAWFSAVCFQWLRTCASISRVNGRVVVTQ
jgi:hypothetical protein